MAEVSLYERLGGAFAIAAVVDHFSDAVVKNPIVGQNSENPAAPGMAHEQSRPASGPEVHAHPVGLRGRRWAREHTPLRKPGSTPLGLEEAHRELKISPAEFDEVAAELGRTLDSSTCPSGRRRRFWVRSPHTRVR